MKKLIAAALLLACSNSMALDEPRDIGGMTAGEYSVYLSQALERGDTEPFNQFAAFVSGFEEAFTAIYFHEVGLGESGFAALKSCTAGDDVELMRWLFSADENRHVQISQLLYVHYRMSCGTELLGPLPQ